jgi:hypothetical protein
LLIANGKNEFNQNIFAFSSNFITKYDQLLKACTESQFDMLLIKNMITTSKGYWYLKAQHYTILTKVVGETIQAHLLQLDSKLWNAQPTLKELSLFPILCIIQCFFQISMKILNITKCSSHG